MLFGAATSSYQIEGGWNEDGKSESIWDDITHMEPCIVLGCHNGDVAADSYHLYKRDVEMIRELGLDVYRFSLSWTRILPTGFPDRINEKGVEYYNNIINELLKYNIQPMITLFHWDLPRKLESLGGWSNSLIVDWFTDYSRIAFELFGDRVKYWITINEPREVCYSGYDYRYNMSGYPDYVCAKMILLAHAKTFHMYDKEYRPTQNGTIGITLSTPFYEPVSEEDAEAAEDVIQFEWGIYANPIFSKSGDFPQSVKEKIAVKSLSQGFPRSRLPAFTPEEIELVKGSSDFLGINHYTTSLVYRNESVNGYYASPSYYDDIGAMIYQDNSWEGSAISSLKVVPWGFYKLLTKIREDYDNPPIYITENGFPTQGGLEDDDRVAYYRKYLDSMLDVIEEGSDIKGYIAWSLMDNFEWNVGYTVKFGLFEVDFESPERTRTPRKAAYVYKEIVRTHTLDFNYEPDMNVAIGIDEGH
ncbi:unnamed protein product [Euphydryas editha]|nr:unnamed protein product [Euphydryas editha]